MLYDQYLEKLAERESKAKKAKRFLKKHKRKIKGAAIGGAAGLALANPVTAGILAAKGGAGAVGAAGLVAAKAAKGAYAAKGVLLPAAGAYYGAKKATKRPF